MQLIPVHTDTPYDVHVGTFLLERVGQTVRETCPGATRTTIVTDTNVGPLYAEVVRTSLTQAGLEPHTFTFEAGEKRKRAATLVNCLEFLAESELSRGDAVVALGGGVVGDLAGFAAASYLRGIAYVQVPTSLLAMVDSSVGGKTAIDLEAGKNLAGAFWQPRAVLADVGCLATLESAQFADGCGEVIKHGVIADPELFAVLEGTPLTLDLLMANVPAVETIVARNVAIKRDVVDADEHEHGIRKLLNFGHSIGHAIELCEHFQRGHGECVAAGMVAITRAVEAEGGCEPGLAERIDAVCRAHGLSTACTWDADELFEAALHDKKRAGDAIDLLIPRAVGDCVIERTPLPRFHELIRAGVSAGKDR